MVDKEPTVTELKPCPFCGGEADLGHYTKSGESDIVGYSVTCNACCAFGEGFDVQGDMPDRIEYAQSLAVNAWNTREEGHRPAPVEVEPVAWRWKQDTSSTNNRPLTPQEMTLEPWRFWDGAERPCFGDNCPAAEPLYAAPPAPEAKDVGEIAEAVVRKAFERFTKTAEFPYSPLAMREALELVRAEIAAPSPEGARAGEDSLSRSQPIVSPKSDNAAAAALVEERECLTPETYYSWGLENARKLTVGVAFPFDIGFWAEGTAHISALDVDENDQAAWDVERLRRYDLQAAERRRITDLIHDQMEAVAADAYRTMCAIDSRLGTEDVAYGIRWARWKRTKEGPRPTPRGSIAVINGSPPDPAGQHGEGPPGAGTLAELRNDRAALTGEGE